VFLTRDAKLAGRRDIEAAVYLLSSNDPADQLRELARHFGIRLAFGAARRRCRSGWLGATSGWGVAV